MHKILKYNIIFSTTFLMSGLAYAEEIGVNAAVKGSVFITSESAARAQAIVKAPINLGDEVDSMVESSLQILLKDNTVFTVGPDANLTIDEFVYNPRSDSNRIKARMTRGIFRYMSGDAARTNPDDITIETPTTSMGIRGTIFEAIVGPEALLCAEKEGIVPDSSLIDYNGATLIVLRGPGEQTNTNERRGELSVTAGGETVTLTQSGTATLISSQDQKPSRVFQISDPLFGFFSRNLRTTPRGDENYDPFIPDPRLIRPDILIQDEEGLVPFSPIEDLDLPRSDLLDLDTPAIEPDINQ